MMFRMLFGMVVSSGLAWGVLSLFGFFRGTITPFGVAAGVLLTGIYFAVFRSGLAGRNREKAVATLWKEVEFEGRKKEGLQTAA